MNIQNRLKLLENQIIEEDSEYCGCKKQRNVRKPGDAPFPEICEFCGKPLLIIHVASREMRGEI
jgi:rRNA maturation endonuclease Nob1